jgi:hypothetical protein
VAPYPFPQIVQEGWMSRIGAIDAQFVGLRRIYLHFSEHHDDGMLEVVWHDAETAEALVNPCGSRSANLITRICAAVKFLYVHTLHLAEYVLPWLECGKVCVDIHGVTPEEEEMLGRPELKARYEAVEQQVLAHAMKCIAVSASMIQHYTEKYPALRPNWITIPIFETYADCQQPQRNSARLEREKPELPVAVVYTGGTQVWQNVAGMLDLVNASADWATFSFYSHDRKQIRKAAAAMKIDAAIHVGYCEKSRLPEVYRMADFGLVLRSDTAVNRVACPTKLIEYLYFGVIPIVRSPRLGDFHARGYQYVLEEDFKAGFFPDISTREWMRKHNFAVGQSIANDFNTGGMALRELACGPAAD